MAEQLIADLNRILQKLFSDQAAHRLDMKILSKELQDLKASVVGGKRIRPTPFKVLTNFNVAIDSWDHKQPRGAANDNTRCPWFVSAAETLFNGKAISHLDLGCAGGGLVFDFLLQGHNSIGIEGSDYLKRTKGGHWLIIPEYLFTADITKPFKVNDKNDLCAKFDIITAMEVMEHIPEYDLDQLIENIHSHLSDSGVFCCSIATFPDFDEKTGAVWHVTLKEKQWWVQRFEAKGFYVDSSNPIDLREFPRGTGNQLAGYGADNDFINNPNLGFHLILRKK